ncbi:hypothetical protein JW979_13835 [bacterium]|nr:hypothetical protein [candidate division CSSED10-310 bacterium]
MKEKPKRYLPAEDKFLGYAFQALGDHYNSWEEFQMKYNTIQTDDDKEKFLEIASFYLFLVKNGHWEVNVDGSDSYVDYLDHSYKFIALFSLIESLMSEDFRDFFSYLNKRDVFPICKEQLKMLYGEYNKQYGSIQNCSKFFEQFAPNSTGNLAKNLEIRGKRFLPEQVAKFLYEIRSKFIHECRLVLETSENPTLSKRQNKSVLSNMTLPNLMELFEEGLINYFGLA